MIIKDQTVLPSGVLKEEWAVLNSKIDEFIGIEAENTKHSLPGKLDGQARSRHIQHHNRDQALGYPFLPDQPEVTLEFVRRKRDKSSSDSESNELKRPKISPEKKSEESVFENDLNSESSNQGDLVSIQKSVFCDHDDVAVVPSNGAGNALPFSVFQYVTGQVPLNGGTNL